MITKLRFELWFYDREANLLKEVPISLPAVKFEMDHKMPYARSWLTLDCNELDPELLEKITKQIMVELVYEDWDEKKINEIRKYLRVFYDNVKEPLFVGEIVSESCKDNLITWELHARSVKYGKDKTDLLRPHRLQEIFFKKLQKHKLLEKFLTVHRVEHNLTFDQKGRNVDDFVYFKHTREEFQRHPGIATFSVNVFLRWDVTTTVEKELSGYSSQECEIIQKQAARAKCAIKVDSETDVMKLLCAQKVFGNESLQVNLDTNIAAKKAEKQRLELFVNVSQLARKPAKPEDRPYLVNEVVEHDGKYYIALDHVANALDHTGNLEKSEWQEIAEPSAHPICAGNNSKWFIESLLKILERIVQKQNKAQITRFKMPIEEVHEIHKNDETEFGTVDNVHVQIGTKEALATVECARLLPLKNSAKLGNTKFGNCMCVLNDEMIEKYKTQAQKTIDDSVKVLKTAMGPKIALGHCKVGGSLAIKARYQHPKETQQQERSETNVR